MKNILSLTFVITVVLGISGMGAASHVRADDRPNLIFILADDLGTGRHANKTDKPAKPGKTPKPDPK